MQKLIFNYKTRDNEDKRLEMYKDSLMTEEVVKSLLFLHSTGLITLENALPIMEVYSNGQI